VKIKKTDVTLPIFEMNTNYLIDYLGLKGVDAYKSLKQLTERLKEKGLTIRDKTKDKEEHELQTNWLASAEYFKSKNCVEFEFSEKLMPYLIGLVGNFTSFQLKSLMRLKNKYAFKIYMILRRWHPHKGEVDFSLKELKKLLMIDRKKAYKEVSNIRVKILQPVRDEINKYTDIKINVELLEKTNRYVGRSPIDTVRFTIQENPDYIPATPPSKELPFSDDEKAALKKSPSQKFAHDIQQQELLIRNIDGKVSDDEASLQKLKLEQLKLEFESLKKSN